VGLDGYQSARARSQFGTLIPSAIGDSGTALKGRIQYPFWGCANAHAKKRPVTVATLTCQVPKVGNQDNKKVPPRDPRNRCGTASLEGFY
jgi:hypothetical protein